MVTYIFSFFKRFLSVRTFATTDVKPYRGTNAPTSGFFDATTSTVFSFTRPVEAIKLPNLLQMKVLSSTIKLTLSFLLELFDVHDFESDNSEEKNYKIESFTN